MRYMVAFDKQIPFIGIVSSSGYIESYDYKKAEECDFHHSFALSERGCEIYEEEGTLRFIMYKGTSYYTLEGTPSLDPFGKGAEQIKLFAKHAIEKGADEGIEIRIAEHYLHTEWEGKSIGMLKDWIID